VMKMCEVELGVDFNSNMRNEQREDSLIACGPLVFRMIMESPAFSN
jgi:hypothetical protein